MKKHKAPDFLVLQTTIFCALIIALVILLIAFIVLFFAADGSFDNIRFLQIIIPLVMFSVFTYGLHRKSKLAYYSGFALIGISIILLLWWVMEFKTTLLPRLIHLSYLMLNVIAITNVLIIFFLLVVFLLSLYVQVKLKKVLVGNLIKRA